MAEAARAGADIRRPGVGGFLRYLPLLVLVFGLAELGAHFFFSRRAPSPEEWAAVRPLVASWWKPESVVVIAPYWAEPLARHGFGDAIMPLRDVARPDATRYAEAIEVSTLGSRSPELAQWKVLREAKQGRFVVRAVVNPSPPVVTYDFTDQVDPAFADARIDHRSGAADCPFHASATAEGGGLGGPPIYPAARFICPGQPAHVSVGVTIIDDEQAHPRRCIWSHPPGDEVELVTRFRNVSLGTMLHGHTGMGWLIERDQAVSRFTIRVTVAGEEVGKVVHQPGDFWKAFEIPLGLAAHRVADVEFRVSAPGGGTHVCFAVDSR